MLTVKEVIHQGFEAYTSNKTILTNPYKRPDESCIQMVYHGRKPLGLRRVLIDFKLMWERGWQLAEMLDNRSIQLMWDNTKGTALA